LKLRLLPVEVTSPEEMAKAFEAIRTARVDAILVGASPFFVAHRQRIVEFAARERLPAIYWWRGFSDSGGLMSYGIDWVEVYRRAGAYVDKILKGAKPGDLPLERPRKFELVINLKTAKALGLTIPQSLLLRADQIIE
jgi:putative tryptophan/tyrosine transport system substrate-binding protein